MTLDEVAANIHSTIDSRIIDNVMLLWDRKKDTRQMASELRMSEAECARWLRIGRERRRLG